MKKIITVLISFMLMFTTVSCSNNDKCIVQITDINGINDGYYNQLTNEGLKKAAKEFDFKLTVLTPKNADEYDSIIKEAVALNPKLIVISSPEMETTAVTYAENYPDMNFIFVESTGDLNIDNVQDATNIYSIEFNRSQAGFLSGILAGTLASSKVAFIGAEEFLSFIEYESGFKAGVVSANNAVTVETKYYPEDTDPAVMKDYVNTLIADGCQVIYTLNKNEGIYQAAKEAGIPVIGFDYDYSDELGNSGDSIVMIVEKQIDTAVYLAVSDYFNGLYKGQIKFFTIADGCLQYKVYNKNIVSPEITAVLDAWATEINNGTFAIPSTRKEMNSFTPAVLQTQTQDTAE